MQSNTRSLNRTIGAAIGAIAVVALVGSTMALSALDQVNHVSAAGRRSREIVSDLDAFQAAMLNQETGARGFLLAGRPDSLEHYSEGRRAMESAIESLKRNIGPNAAERAPLERAEQAARNWQVNIGEPIVRANADPTTRDQARLLESTGVGTAAFDRFRKTLSPIMDVERRAFEVQRQGVQNARDRLATVLAVSTVLTLLICLSVWVAINRLVATPLIQLADVMGRLVRRDTAVAVPSLRQRNEVGVMARAVQVFKESLIELDRTSLLRVTTDTLPALVGYVDAGRRVGFLNDEFTRWFDLGGADVSEVQGRTLDELFPEKSFPGDGEPLDKALAGEETRFALEFAPKGGDLHDVEAHFRPHRAPDGRVLGVITLFTDVTDRKDVDRQLRIQARELQRSNEELEQFAYIASHDLKAPLRGIENLASWIEEDLAERLTGDTRTNMDLLRNRVRRLEALLDDLLAYSRAGRDSLVLRQVDTRALVSELAALISPPEGFSIEASPGLPKLTTPQAALSQVLQNLMGNAIKHHSDPKHGHVWVDAERQGDVYDFTVSDDGPGVPEQFRERVFGMFQTLRPRDEVEGSGMGLAIVRKLIERQAGNVWLSDRPGGGLVVHFTWPATPGGFEWPHP